LNENKVEADELNENEIDSGILQLKNNVLPRGLVPLEDLFDFNDVANKMKIEASGKEVEECNIGTEEKPKMIKLYKYFPLEKKRKYIELFKEYVDVFSWGYEDLKSYEQHWILHKRRTQTFQAET
jgi:hypothetical protein